MIEIKNFTKAYNSEKKAVDDISLTVNNGEIFALLATMELEKPLHLKQWQEF